MKLATAIISTLFMSCLTINCFTQDNTICFNHLKIEDGLPHNMVMQVMLDSKGFMWFATKGGLSRYDGSRFKNFSYDPQYASTSLGNNYTVSLCEDRNGNILVGTIKGLYLFDSKHERFSHFTVKTSNGTQISGKVTSIDEDNNGNIWIADYAHGVFLYNTKTEKLHCFSHNSKKGSLSANQIMSICVDKDNSVWVGVLGMDNGGLNRFNPSDSTFIYFANFKGGVNKIVESDDNNLLIGTPNQGVYTFNRVTNEKKSLYVNHQVTTFVNDIMVNGSDIWIGTASGLYIYNRNNTSVKMVVADYSDRSSLSCSDVRSIVCDRDGGVWMATITGGVNYLQSTYKDFEKFHPLTNNRQLRGKEVRHFCQDDNGIIWIATEYPGFTKFDPCTNLFSRTFDKPGQLMGQNIQTMMFDKNNLWIGYLGQGIDIIDVKSGKRRNHATNDVDANSLNDNSILSLCKDRDNNIWIGTTRGANLYNRANDSFISVISRESGEYIYDIIEDHDGLIWFASYTRGVHCFNPRTKVWDNFLNVPGDSNSLGYDRTIGLFEDSKHNIWVLTEGGGVSCYSKAKQQFKTYNTNNGLPNNVAYEMVEDEMGKLWISTNNGLACFNPISSTFRIYSFAKGPLNNQFYLGASLTDDDGKLYFGGTEGFIRFQPRLLKTKETESAIMLTGLQVFNKEVVVGTEGAPINESIVSTQKIKLNYKQSTFSFEFALLDYNISAVNQYAYKMEGYEQDWIKLNSNQRITYSNLPAGHYKFHVIGANSNGIWNKQSRTVEVIISCPPWLSAYAISAYIIIILNVAYYIINFYIKNIRIKKQQIINEMIAAKDKAIYETKVNFFTSVAHEIRTPLSLIKAPFELLQSSGLNTQEYTENMNIMNENIDRLMVLVNQLLDISKMDNQGISFCYSMNNVNELIENILHRFKPTFRIKGLDVKTTFQSPIILSYIDRELFTKVISNLVNNATKFAIKIIIIELYSQDDNFIFRISNDGKVIEHEYRERIFEKFYQVSGSTSSGVGIGLALVQQLVALHKGKVYFDNTETGLNSFVVEIPIILNYPKQTINEETVCETTECENIIDEDVEARTLIMIVEDDKSMRSFLKSLISRKYRVMTACNGEEALTGIKEHLPDLIVSDVIMPKIDGLTLCRKIKSQKEYLHIPIILLTAKFDLKSKIDGIKMGADAYVEKPFSTEFLMAQIYNILQNNRTIKENVINSPPILTNTIDRNADEESFIKRVIEITIRNLSDQSFSVDQIAIELTMSRSSLYRKLKEVSNMTPNEFIQITRLNKAAEMIEQGNLRINEIGYMTGFSSSSYFAKCFQKQFGVSPKNYTKQLITSESTTIKHPLE